MLTIHRLICVVFFETLIPIVFGHYCEISLCEPHGYCCGENKCCYHVPTFWYLWFGLGCVIITIFVLLFYKYYFAGRRKKNEFVPLIENVQEQA